jgi:7-cyano-7-deazaguanine synthase in queuosine biosynthesis
MSDKKELVLVSCSGGMDSSCTAAILKLSGYENIILIHYKYGHRGQECEEIAIKNIAQELNLPLKIIDVENLYKTIDIKDVSMLANENAPITTGTAAGLKTVHAWVPGRNMLFMTVMGIVAETEVMKKDYDTVYFVGGWLNLTESGCYNDNSESFCDSFLNMFKYGTLIGSRIKPLYCLSNLMKFEQFVLIKEFNLQKIYRNTISCDRPIIEHPMCDHAKINYIPDNCKDGVPCNCLVNGAPGCGSGALSAWAAKMIGLDDLAMRNFCEVSDPNYKAYVPKHLSQNIKRIPDINSIIDRILLPPDKLDNLRKQLIENKKLAS